MTQLNLGHGDIAAGQDIISPAPQLPRESEAYELTSRPQHDGCVAATSPVEDGANDAEGGDANSQSPRSKFKTFMTLIGLYLSLFIYALDETVVATAVPTISSDLHSAAGYAWIGSAFVLAAASSAAIWSKLSEIWGRKPILLAATAGFSLSSIVCALAQNSTTLIIGRALQGTAAGGLSQIVSITVSDLFSLRARGFYLALLEFVWAVAAGLGPVLGGVLSQNVSWRWIFWMNLPFCGFTFVTLYFFLDVHNPRTEIRDGLKAIDWVGCAAMIAMSVMVLLGLDFGGVTFPWSSPKVICLIVFGCLTSIFFVFAEKRLAKYPLIELSLFTNAHNIGCFLIYSVLGFVFIGDVYFLPLYFQSALEAGPVRSGVLIIPASITGAVVGIVVGMVIHRTGRFREYLWIGTSILTLGNGLLILLKPDTSLAQVIGFGLIASAGAGFLFPTAVIAVQANVRKDLVGAATSTIFFCQLFSTAITLVIGIVVFQNSMDQHVAALHDSGLSNKTLDLLEGGNAAANVLVIRKIPDEGQKNLVKSAFAESISHVWILYTCVASVGILASIFVKQRELSKEHVETKTGLKKDN